MLKPVIQDNRRWWIREHIAGLVLFGLLFFLPGISQIPLFDRDEPRFASAAREMSERNDYFIPHFNGDLRPDKPPLVYWLMNGVHYVSGSWNELTVRLPSVICGILTLLVVYFMVGARFGPATALIAALMLGSCGTFVVESRLATADATMLFFTVVCMSCAWRAWDTETDARMPAWVAAAFWVSLAAGALAKGVPLIFVLVPMVTLSIATGAMAELVRRWRSHLHVTRMRLGLALGIGMVASAILVGTAHAGTMEARWWTVILAILFIGMTLTPGLPGVAVRCITGGNWRWWRNLRPAWGIPLLLALIAAWAVPAGIREPALLQQMVGIHFLQRAAGPLLTWMHIDLHTLARAGGASSMQSYAKPPGFYFAMVWVTFWPWSVLLIPTAYFTWRRLRGRTAIAIDPKPYQFLVAWILPMWVLLEVARGKLPHYTLPTYVGIAILCADTLEQSFHRLTDVLAARWFAQLRWAVLGIWCAIGLAVVIAADRFAEPEMFWRCVLVAAAFVAAGVAGTIAWNRLSWPLITAFGWGVALLLLNTLVLPDARELQVSKRVAAKMEEIRSKEPDFQLAAVGETVLPAAIDGEKNTKLPGYQEGSLVFYAGEHVRMGFPTGDDTSADDMLRVIPFAPAQVPEKKYLIAVDDPTLEYLVHREPKIVFYKLGRFTGFDTGNSKPVAVTVISNVLPREDVISATLPASQATSQPAAH